MDTFLRNLLEAVYSLTPFAERTVVLVPESLHNPVSQVAESTCFDEDVIAFTVATFLCFPLAVIINMAPFGMPKHFLSFLFGAFLLQFTIGAQWVHLLVDSLVTYFLLLCFSPKQNRIVVPVFLITYLSLGHLHRMYASYLVWNMDFTTSLMILTIKLYSLAYNMYDGEKLKQSDQTGVKVDRATLRCARFAVFDMPGFLEYMGYTFCFSTVLAGPAIEYKIYADACSGALLYTPNGTLKGKIPSRMWPTLLPFLQSIVCMGIYIIGSQAFPFLDPDNPASNTPVVLTNKFLERSFIQRYLYGYVSLSIVHMKYFFPWKSAEASMNLWYAGFEGFDERGNSKGFENSENVDIKTFELTSSFQVLTRSLNKKTAKWLSRYVYARTNGSLVATYFLSAFWHGFYPGYYLYFLSSPLMSMCERLGERKISPYCDSGWTKFIWKAFNLLWLKLVLGYMGGPFFLLSFDWSMLWWRSYNYYGHIACILYYAALSLLPSKKQKGL